MDATLRKFVLIGGCAVAGATIAPKIESEAQLRVDRAQKQTFGAVFGGLLGVFLYYRTSVLADQAS